MSRGAWIIAWAAVTVPLLGFWSYGLFDLDEGIYAASLREMLESGNWVVVTYDGAPFLEKPILIYWVASCFLKMGLAGEFALRLGSVLATVGTLAVTSRFAFVHFGESVALWSLILLGSSILFVGVGTMFIPDAFLVFFLCVSLYSFWESLTAGPRWRWLSGLALGLATLAKGPVAVVIFTLLALYVYVRMPAFRHKYRGGWFIGTILFLISVATWYLPVALVRGREFFTEFIIFQNIGRFQGLDVAHAAPFYFYFPVVILALAPFSIGLWGCYKTTRSRSVELLLWAWVITVFVLFSIAGSKLPHYILPLLPPSAILLAAHFAAKPMSMRFVPVFYAGLLAASCAWTASALPRYSEPFIYLMSASFFSLVASFPAARRGFLFSASVAQWPIVAAGLLLAVPAFWRTEYRDAHVAARLARSAKKPIVEFRMEAMGAPLATSHPSLRWYYGQPAGTATWLDEVAHLPAGTLILSRRGRLGDGQLRALRSLGTLCELVATAGEFEVYEAVGATEVLDRSR